ncbi:hypothetical protein [Methylobacterium sp. GC_Met_2]|uniref:hypothetical protein n=1 Tax=Methylobacterium sp. GC_Met_2 TaxID=2937376 RepID=UPI00226B2253|nr:hypothetical protein [Methylobacterium sp. GC_Met_2]
MTVPSSPEPVTPAAILVLLAGIERHDPGAPAALAFRSALKRKGAEADQAGGLEALDTLTDAVAAADPERADARLATLRTAWGELLPACRRKTRP